MRACTSAHHLMARQLDIAEGSRYRPVVRINTLADADATAPTLMIRAAPVTFPISISSPIRHPGPPPSACDVVVIGGGVIGVMTAWFLAEPGLRVTLCEKGRIAGEQSSRNWGWLRQQGRDPAELPIMVESLRIWDRLAQEFGDALGVRRTGVMYLADTEADLVAYEAWLAHAQANELDTHMLGRAEVIDRLRGSAGLWRGALFTPSDALAEPWAAVPVFAEGATTRGAVIVENCAVRALDRQGGRIAGVITEAGRITCEQVVLAGGAWSSLLLRAEGVTLPQLAVLASVAATEPLPEVFPGAAADGRFAFRRRADGGYTLAAGGGTASSSAPMPCAMHAHLCPSCEGTGARCG